MANDVGQLLVALVLLALTEQFSGAERAEEPTSTSLGTFGIP